MSSHSVRAKIQHKNRHIHLGYYQTQAQATAAKAGAHAALDKWEEHNSSKPAPPAPKQKLPNIQTLQHFVTQGVYDSVIEELGAIIIARVSFIRRLQQARNTGENWFGKHELSDFSHEFAERPDRFGKFGQLID
tara:strand:- start:249 stop:650 length:402 start_codon:yes stop_codon:yes gene_type:complete